MLCCLAIFFHGARWVAKPCRDSWCIVDESLWLSTPFLSNFDTLLLPLPLHFSSSTPTVLPASLPSHRCCKVVENFINGSFSKSSSVNFIDVTNPATNEVVCRVPESTRHEMEEAAGAAQEAFGTWREVPVQQRQRIMFDLQKLIRDNTDELAESITLEQGKTIPDAKGDVFRGLEIVEMSSGLGHLMMGETQGNLSKGIDSYSYREPLGVTAGICPFNFPAMIPLWMFPVAVTAGNTSVIKPRSVRAFVGLLV